MLMGLDRREEIINYTRCKLLWQKNSSSCNNYFHFITLSPSLRWELGKKFFFAFILFIFALFAVSYNKMKILLQIYLIISVKKKKKRQQIKQNRNELIRFFLQHYPTDYPTVLYLFVCVFFFCFFSTQNKEGKSLNFLCLLNDVSFPLGCHQSQT